MEHYSDFDKKIGFVLNSAYGSGGCRIPKKAYPYLKEKGYECYSESLYNFDLKRINPVLVNAVIAYPELFEEKSVSLYVVFAPFVDFIAGSVSIHDYDGSETININEDKTKLFINSLKMNVANSIQTKSECNCQNELDKLIKSIEELRPEVFEPKKHQILFPDGKTFK